MIRITDANRTSDHAHESKIINRQTYVSGTDTYVWYFVRFTAENEDTSYSCSGCFGIGYRMFGNRLPTADFRLKLNGNTQLPPVGSFDRPVLFKSVHGKEKRT